MEPICIKDPYYHNYTPIEVEGVSYFDSKQWKCKRCDKVISLREWKAHYASIVKTNLQVKYSMKP